MKKYSSILFSDNESIDNICRNAIEFIFRKELNETGGAVFSIRENDEINSEFVFHNSTQIEAIISELYKLQYMLTTKEINEKASSTKESC